MVPGALQKLPPAQRGTVEHITRTAFTSGLNLILLVGAIIAFVAGVIAFVTIRQRDFVHPDGPPPAGH
jgi:hypothetical protein